MYCLKPSNWIYCHLFIALGALLDFANAQNNEPETIVHFDNIVASPEPFTKFNIWAGSSIDRGTAYPKVTAQRFLAGDVVGVLGEFEVDSVPVFSDWCNQRDLGTATVKGMVEGLETGKEYFVILEESSEDLPQNSDSDSGPCGGPVRAWIINFAPDNSPGQIGRGGAHLTDWPWPSGGFPAGHWIPYEDHLANHSLRARIEGTASDVSSTDPFLIATTEDGSVTQVPDLDKYAIGSEVSVTAEPEPGFEFVKWTYGDEELTSNPAIITIAEGVTLIPIFAMVGEPEPLNIDIAHAVAVSWESQADKSYQIHRSTDMETWEVAIDDIAGTGDRLTQCFIREETEVFYRVEEKL